MNPVNVTPERLLQLIGIQTVEILTLRGVVEELQKRLAALQPASENKG